MRGVLIVLLFLLPTLLLAGIVIATVNPPSPPSPPTLNPDNCSWTTSSEVCDGIDNDCNGLIDDGINCGGDTNTNTNTNTNINSPGRTSGPIYPGTTVTTPPVNDTTTVSSNNNNNNDNSESLTKDEQREAEDHQILAELNLTEKPKLTEDPVNSVKFWTKKLFIYGGFGLLLIIIGVVIVLFVVEKKRRTFLQTQEVAVRAQHVAMKKDASSQKVKSPQEKVAFYISHMRQKGYSNEFIKSNLVDAGWSTDQLKHFF